MVAADAGPERKSARPFKGPPTRPEGYKPVCSIPAKFETVLFQGARERKGFGSEGRRFGSDETDNPGPGTYSTADLPSTSALQRAPESTSKKGYGPMASVSHRFKHKARYTGPGPGTYAPPPVVQQAVVHLGATSSFHPQVPKVKDLQREPEALPGPGAYDGHTVTRTGKQLDLLSTATSHASAFKAGGHKLTLLGSMESPPPTKYSLTDPWEQVGTGKGGGGGGSRAGTSSFAGRSIASLNTSVPAVVFLEDSSGAGKPDTGPGPGAYEMQDVKSFKASLAKAAARQSAAFHAPEFVDRFQRPLAQGAAQAPASSFSVGQQGSGDAAAAPSAPGGGGAGSGHAGGHVWGDGKGVSAPFKSRSAGHGDYDIHELARAPGPAFYDPHPMPHRSYHTNARKAFVAPMKV